MEQKIVIRTEAEFDKLVDYIQDKEYIAFDTETTGVEKSSNIIGFSLCAELDTGCYVVLSEWSTAESKLLTTQIGSNLVKIKTLFSKLTTKKLIAHNAVFDCDMINNNFQVDLMPYIHTDTMILGHLLNENRSNGLKELAVSIFGEDVRKEQLEMKESVHRNGGVLTKDKYELYKADSELIAQYGAQDALLTLKLFYHFVPELIEQGLDTFFYDEESMPQLRGPTYDLNTTGLRVDPEKLQTLRVTLEADCMEARAFIYKEIEPIIKDKYPGTKPSNTFNIDAPKQLSWLLFYKLNNEFNTLTKTGKEVCRAMGLKLPYSPAAKRLFIRTIEANKGQIYEKAKYNHKTKKLGRPKKVADVWHYIQAGKETLKKLSNKYQWVDKFLQYKLDDKMLNTYVLGIQSRMRYNIIRPSFLQHGTTSGRYSSKAPNFQNLPRGDKRVKSCIVSRPGKVFIGADYSQLEPRVFASIAQDKALMECFAKGEDFYSVIGASIFEKQGYSLYKDDPNSFAKEFPILRERAKVIALATPYGRTAAQQAGAMGITREESQTLINRYWEAYPSVLAMMLESHEIAKRDGIVYNSFGRPRRIPEAKEIKKLYGNTPHEELPYEVRTLLNLAMNHRVQSTGASVVNRVAIAFDDYRDKVAEIDSRWLETKIVLQVHDELILEADECLANDTVKVLKYCMEKTVKLLGVDLIAEPKIAKDLASLK